MKLFILRGLPGSGKSTAAQQLVEKDRNLVRVNKDLLREMAYFLRKNWGPNGSNFRVHVEPFIIKAEVLLTEYFLSQMFDVIVDDTNLTDKHINRFKRLATKVGAEFHIVELSVNIETCIERDKNRPDSVGEKVIKNMAKGFYGNNYKQRAS